MSGRATSTDGGAGAGPTPQGERDRPSRTGISVWLLLFAVVASPFIWMGHISFGPALASYQCREHTTWPNNVLTVVHVIPIVLALVVGWRILHRAREAPDSRSSSTVVFLAVVGLGFAAISLYVTVLEGIPNLVGVPSCPR